MVLTILAGLAQLMQEQKSQSVREKWPWVASQKRKMDELAKVCYACYSDLWPQELRKKLESLM